VRQRDRFVPLPLHKPARYAGVNGKGFGHLSGYVPVALVPGVVAKPGNSVGTKASKVRVRFGSFNRQRRW
jgi:hypothetical protein